MNWKGEVTVIDASPWALTVDHEGEVDSVPKTEIQDGSEVYDDQHVGKTGTLVIPMALARDIGWE